MAFAAEGQSVHTAAPVDTMNFPVSQFAHDTRPVTLENLPTAQPVQTLADAAAYVPAAHSAQTERPAVLANLPAWQSVQPVEPVDTWNLPVWQSAQVDVMT